MPKLLLMLFGFLVGALIAEVGLRIAGYSYPEFYQPDLTRGYALKPNSEGWYRKEGEAFVRINSDGLRDDEHVSSEQTDVLRIAILGDSYAEALQVPVENAFWQVMENKLHECSSFQPKKIEAINFGVSGYGTAQQLITLREHVWKYSPDIVLLTVTTNNDIADNSKTLKRTDKIPYFVLRNGALTLDNSFQETRSFRLQHSKFSVLGRWFRDNLRLVQAVGQGHRALRIKLQEWRSKPPAPTTKDQTTQADEAEVLARSAELGTDNVIYFDTDDPVWKDAWVVTEQTIKTMRNEVESHGAKFLVVTLSNGPQVWPDVKVRREFMRRFAVQDIFRPDNRIKEFCDREEIPVLVLAPELQTYADQNGAFLHGFEGSKGMGHWNSTGHRVAGEIIADRLCAGSLLK